MSTVEHSILVLSTHTHTFALLSCYPRIPIDPGKQGTAKVHRGLCQLAHFPCEATMRTGIGVALVPTHPLTSRWCYKNVFLLYESATSKRSRRLVDAGFVQHSCLKKLSKTTHATLNLVCRPQRNEICASHKHCSNHQVHML